MALGSFKLPSLDQKMAAQNKKQGFALPTFLGRPCFLFFSAAKQFLAMGS